MRAELHRPDGDRSEGVAAAFADFIFGDREPLVRLLTTEAGQRRWHEQYLFGCNPMIDPLWSDERFVVAMRKIDDRTLSARASVGVSAAATIALKWRLRVCRPPAHKRNEKRAPVTQPTRCRIEWLRSRDTRKKSRSKLRLARR
jgi:hypothetical protein